MAFGQCGLYLEEFSFTHSAKRDGTSDVGAFVQHRYSWMELSDEGAVLHVGLHHLL